MKSTFLYFLNIIIALFVFGSCQKQDAIKNENAAVAINTNASLSEPGFEDHLEAWYTFNGNTLDSSGNDNNVIFNNATPVPDKHGNPNGAYAFNGIDNYMRVKNSSSLNPKQAITLYALIKVNGFYQGTCHDNRILNKGLQDVTNGLYFLNFNDGYYYQYNQCDKIVKENKENFGAAYGNGELKSAGGVDTLNYVKTNKWYAITYTYDGLTSNFYINGKLKYTSVGDFKFNPNSDDLYFGTSNIKFVNYPYWFNGVIDEIRIYSKALTAKQVSNLPD